MPIIEQSSYKAPPFPLCCNHVQTILPSYLRHVRLPEHWEREAFHTPDDDELLLDWARVGSDRLLIISHGLCGSSTRHYVLSLVHAFNKAGWDFSRGISVARAARLEKSGNSRRTIRRMSWIG